MINKMNDKKTIFFDVGNVLVYKKTSEGFNIGKILGFDESEYENILSKVVESAPSDLGVRFWELRTLEEEINYLNEFHTYFLKYLGKPYDLAIIEKLTRCRTNGDYAIIDGVVENLEKLSKLYNLGIISNALPSRRHHELKLDNIDNYFNPIIISWEVGIQKPDPQIYKIAMEKANAKPEDIIFIDDKEKFLMGAKSAGIENLILFSKKELETNHIKFNDFNKLSNYLISL